MTLRHGRVSGDSSCGWCCNELTLIEEPGSGEGVLRALPHDCICCDSKYKFRGAESFGGGVETLSIGLRSFVASATTRPCEDDDSTIRSALPFVVEG